MDDLMRAVAWGTRLQRAGDLAVVEGPDDNGCLVRFDSRPGQQTHLWARTRAFVPYATRDPGTGIYAVAVGGPVRVAELTAADARPIPVPVVTFPPLKRKAAVFHFFAISDRPQVRDDPAATTLGQNSTWVETVAEYDRATKRGLRPIIDARKPDLLAAKLKTCYALWLASATLAEAERDTPALKKRTKGLKPIISYVDSRTPPTRPPKGIAVLGLPIYHLKENEGPAALEARWTKYLKTLPASQKVALIGRASKLFTLDTPAEVLACAAVTAKLAARFPNVIAVGWFSDEPSRGCRHPELAPVLRKPLAAWFKTVTGRP
jgi:hypothetical protein